MKKWSTKPEMSLHHCISPPWHFWFVGLFYVLLNAVGAYDYIMTLEQNATYFRSQNYGDTQIAYFTNYPLLPAIFWTIAVSSALAASILLLCLTLWAKLVAVIAVVSQLCLDLVTFGFLNRWHVFGARQSLFDLVILLLTIGLFLYSRSMSVRGVLR